jgi:hypothetical protein
MRPSTIKFEKSTVTKTSAPKLMCVEVEKTLRACKIGEDCGLFCVPKVLDYDNDEGVAVFERLPLISPVANILKKTKNCNSIVEQIGSALAVIHRELTLPDDMTIELPQEFRLAGTEVYFHGDFNGVNVCIVPNAPSILILDWQMTGQHGGEATYGSRYFDLLWFINYLLWTPNYKFLFNDTVNKVAKLFLESYFKESESIYDVEMFIRYSKNFFEAKLPNRKQNAGWRESFLLPLSYVLTKRFIKSLNSLQPDNDF